MRGLEKTKEFRSLRPARILPLDFYTGAPNFLQNSLAGRDLSHPRCRLAYPLMPNRDASPPASCQILPVISTREKLTRE